MTSVSATPRYRPAVGPKQRLSVVIATYGRRELLKRTLWGLARSHKLPGPFEVIVVDDGSLPAVSWADFPPTPPFRARLIRQANAGVGAARDAGIRAAESEIVLLLDDDMAVAPCLLAEHLRAHAAGAQVVQGRISMPPDPELPVFERFHLRQVQAYADRFASGSLEFRGVHLCTGNVSFRRDLYLEVGGFDVGLSRSEDRDLGLRFEQSGARLAFAPDAKTLHCTDHTSVEVWLNRAYAYGVSDSAIGRKHPDWEVANPWRFLYHVPAVARPLLVASGLFPAASRSLGRPLVGLARVLDELHGDAVANRLTTLAYGMAYFAGMRDAAGGTRPWLVDGWNHQRLRRGLAAPRKPRSGGRAALERFQEAVRADHRSVQRYRAHYHSDAVPRSRLPFHLVSKIGLQMLTAIRLMGLARDLGLAGVPQVLSRLIRHVYGAEIHWDARIEPGISIVHGNGLVISHAAVVSSGCILSQNVTLGEGIDPESRKIGAPQLEADVHVGPGATLLGPIRVGSASKIMAGAVLAHSVPPRSRVSPPEPRVEARG